MGPVESPFEGLVITPLKIFRDERGAVLHMLRSDSPLFKTFGEVYFSLVNPHQIKGWKRHKVMEQNFAVPSGNMKFIFIDSRENSKTYNQRFEVIIGVDNYHLIQVPPMIWYSFACIGEQPSLIANCASIPHDPNESETLPLNSFAI